MVGVTSPQSDAASLGTDCRRRGLRLGLGRPEGHGKFSAVAHAVGVAADAHDLAGVEAAVDERGRAGRWTRRRWQARLLDRWWGAERSEGCAGRVDRTLCLRGGALRAPGIGRTPGACCRGDRGTGGARVRLDPACGRRPSGMAGTAGEVREDDVACRMNYGRGAQECPAMCSRLGVHQAVENR